MINLGDFWNILIVKLESVLFFFVQVKVGALAQMLMCKHLFLLINNTGAVSVTGEYYGETRLPIHINDINCHGNETSLFNCSFNTMTNYYCYHYHDAAVICQSELLPN